MKVIPFLIAVIFATLPVHVNSISFQGIGFTSSEAFQSVPYNISSDGSTVVGLVDSPSGREAFVWSSPAGIVGIGDLPGSGLNSLAFSASGDGSVIVGQGSRDNPFADSAAFRWDASNGIQGIGSLNPPLPVGSARDVSSDGSIITGYTATPFQGGPSTYSQAFIWTEANGFTGLGYLPQTNANSEAFAISADGSVVVGHSGSSNVILGFIWDEQQGMRPVGDYPGGTYAYYARDISGDGTKVIGTGYHTPISSNENAYIWDASSGFTNLGDLPGGSNYAEARSISGDGKTVVGHSSTGIYDEAFIWDEQNGMRLLSDFLTNVGLAEMLSGWRLLSASGVSYDGQVITGYGLNPDGKIEGWVADIRSDSVPEPTTAILVLLSISSILLIKRKRAVL